MADTKTPRVVVRRLVRSDDRYSEVGPHALNVLVSGARYSVWMVCHGETEEDMFTDLNQRLTAWHAGEMAYAMGRHEEAEELFKGMWPKAVARTA